MQSIIQICIDFPLNPMNLNTGNYINYVVSGYESSLESDQPFSNLSRQIYTSTLYLSRHLDKYIMISGESEECNPPPLEKKLDQTI